MQAATGLPSGSTGRLPWVYRALSVVLLGCLLLLPGCGGCNRDGKELEGISDAEKRAEELRKKREQEKLDDFRFPQLATLPHPTERVERGVKPGHWAAGHLQAVANNFDFRGQLAIEPYDLDDMPFRMGTARQAVLPKGQRRELEVLVFPPVGVNPRAVGVDLQSPRGGLIHRELFPITRLPDHQYYLVVLARVPEQYSFLPNVDTVKAPQGGLRMPGSDAHYRPLMPLVQRSVPLPTSLNTWTSIAWLLWDDIDPDLLNDDQKQALLDWLHWGGQLVISGPSSLAGLSGSFLDPYLPADSSESLEFTAEQLAELSLRWSDPEVPLRAPRPWPGEKLDVRPGARTLVAAEEHPLVVHRQVGRGRVVLTAFALSQRNLTEWSGFDNFLNGCLLLRPPREFRFRDAEIHTTWSDRVSIEAPGRVSQLRFFTRDAGRPRDELVRRTDFTRIEEPIELPPDQELDDLAFTDTIEVMQYGSGAAGWNDFSMPSAEARHALRDAAGIKIPSPRFVVGALSVYLLVLIPLNWGLFRALGRVEWAWVAAPIISLIGAMVVVRAAQLDIGFARATNELAVIEIQPDYPRAHVTRYAALYTSLSTAYDVEFDDFGAVAMPFADGTGLLRGQSRSTVTLRRDDTPALQDFRVASNSIGLVHAEHMLPLAGTFDLEDSDGGHVLHNRSEWQLRDAYLAYGGRMVRLGTLEPGEAREIAFDGAVPAPSDEDRRRRAPEDLETDWPLASGDVDPREMLRVALRESARDEWRLVGWIDEPVAGMTIQPAAAQSRQRGVVVAHLRYGQAPEPTRDTFMRSQIERRHRIEGRRYQEPE